MRLNNFQSNKLITKNLLNAEAARSYSLETLVEKTPESSVQRTKGCCALYRSTANRTMCYREDIQKLFSHRLKKGVKFIDYPKGLA